MAVRRYGPTRGAGVRIEEQDGNKSITPGDLGWVGYAGILEKGATGKLILCPTAADFLRKCGGVIPESQVADVANDYYKLANGAGGIALVRVTDGNERQAEALLYSRIGTKFTQMGKLQAANGGRWGGKELRVFGTMLSGASLTNTTLQIEAAQASSFKVDELKGGYVELSAVNNKRYLVIGNSATGLVTVAADSTMKTDFASASDFKYYIPVDNAGKAVSFQIDDGEEDQDGQFSIAVYVDGARAKTWGNLATAPTAARYWVNVINNDPSNDFVFATDLWTGADAPTVRPANYYSKVNTVTASVLTAIIHTFEINSAGGGNPTMTLGTTADIMEEQVITITMTNATTGTAVSDRFGTLGAVTLGSLVTPLCKYAPPFTVTAGASPLSAADTLVIRFRPFRASALIGGFVYADKLNFKRTKFRIVANDHKTITVAAGLDMTTVSTAGDEFMVTYPQEMKLGRDGNSVVVDTNYQQPAWDTSTSPFNDLEGLNLGVVKFATPGITSTAVQKSGVAYADAKNQQYRLEMPSNILDEVSAIAYINDTIGRSDYEVVSWPSYGYVPDPDPAAQREGKLKLISLTGMIHGREARIAADFGGYHKAEAGVDATLPRLLKLPIKDGKYNEELLNPAGIGIIKKKRGNYILWGDRTCHVDSNWKFKHHREQMSYYEHVLQESFDFIVFAINDSDTDDLARSAFLTFFQPEWAKRAIRGKTVQDAAKIKIDAETNTDAVRAAGDNIAELSLKLADTVERFIIRIGKQGIFEQVG